MACGWDKGRWIVGLALVLGACAISVFTARAADPTTRPAPTSVHAIQTFSSTPAPAPTPATAPAPPSGRAPGAPGAPGVPVAPGVTTPKTVADLRDIEQKVEGVIKKVRICTVALIIGHSQGSGVIVSKDGYILTAGHVVQKPGLDVTVIFADGRKVRAKTLGINSGIDSGLVKITDKGDWPHVEMGHSADLKPGEFCIAMGHPNGYHRDRPPVVRLGRVLESNSRMIYTDCTLVSGDSGGPLFDLDSNVIGINSRIGDPTFANLHVPVDTYRRTWDRLAKGDVWDGSLSPGGPMLGVQGEDHPKGCRILSLVKDSPAEKAGLLVGDIIVKFDGQPIDGLETLIDQIARHKIGDAVGIEVLRGRETHKRTATLAARPGK